LSWKLAAVPAARLRWRFWSLPCLFHGRPHVGHLRPRAALALSAVTGGCQSASFPCSSSHVVPLLVSVRLSSPRPSSRPPSHLLRVVPRFRFWLGVFFSFQRVTLFYMHRLCHMAQLASCYVFGIIGNLIIGAIRLQPLQPHPRHIRAVWRVPGVLMAQLCLVITNSYHGMAGFQRSHVTACTLRASVSTVLL